MSAMEKMNKEQNDRALFVCLFVFSKRDPEISELFFFLTTQLLNKEKEEITSLHSLAVNCRTPCSGVDAKE